jgi:hypothetical protein
MLVAPENTSVSPWARYISKATARHTIQNKRKDRKYTSALTLLNFSENFFLSEPESTIVRVMTVKKKKKFWEELIAYRYFP